MGRYKGPGICWSGDCTAVATRRIGIDEEGRETKVCEPCYTRTIGAFLQKAKDIAEEITGKSIPHH